MEKNKITGKISEFQSMGTVDGPGIRYVLFMQGCPLRCVYCHNPETWSTEGKEYSVEEVVKKILNCREYITRNGGVTVSGGEPLMQWEFINELFIRMKEEGIHTSLDTSGICDIEGAKQVLEHTDLVICDLKFTSEEEYLKYTKGSLKKVFEFLDETKKQNVPLWIRHVVVPDINDNIKDIKKVNLIGKRYENLEKIELLPFRKLCISKYEGMKLDFPLKDKREISDKEIENFSRYLI